MARPWLLAGVVALLGAVALLADAGAANWARTVSPSEQSLARLVTALGNSNYMLVGSAAVAAGAWWRYRRAAPRALRATLAHVVDQAFFVFAAVATSGLAAQLIKHVIGRARPQVADTLTTLAFHPFALGNGFASFPSGHTTSAFAGAMALSLSVPRARVALFAVAIAVGVSRVVLREHYPSDVVGGAGLGILVALALAPLPTPSRALRAWITGGWTRAREPGSRPGRAPIDIGALFARHGAAPALVAGLFAIAVPPTDLLGSETLENVKDGCAILLALGGLTMRALVAGFGQTMTGPASAPVLTTQGVYACCRHPVYLGNILIFTAIMAMHGNPWTVLLGTATYLLINHLVVRTEEGRLLRTCGAAYAAYSRAVPRWLPDLDRLGAACDGERPFDLGRVLQLEYPVIGSTIVALAAAEMYEAVQEPWIGGQVLYVQGLATVILGVSLAVGVAWLVRRRWMFDPR